MDDEDKASYEHPAYERAHRLYLTIAPASEAAYNTLSLREQYLVDIMHFQNMTLNSGITGYMDGWYADHALQCLEALQAIGATESHRFLHNAFDLFPGGRPASETREREEQRKLIAGDLNDFEDLVDGGLEYELWELFLRYWDAHEPSA